MPQPKRIGAPDTNGQVKVDAEYIKNLRNECRTRRLRERELLAELAKLRGGNAEPVAPIEEVSEVPQS